MSRICFAKDDGFTASCATIRLHISPLLSGSRNRVIQPSNQHFPRSLIRNQPTLHTPPSHCPTSDLQRIFDPHRPPIQQAASVSLSTPVGGELRRTARGRAPNKEIISTAQRIEQAPLYLRRRQRPAPAANERGFLNRAPRRDRGAPDPAPAPASQFSIRMKILAAAAGMKAATRAGRWKGTGQIGAACGPTGSEGRKRLLFCWTHGLLLGLAYGPVTCSGPFFLSPPR